MPGDESQIDHLLKARVEIDAEASSLDNSWVDLDYALVDRATQTRYDAYTTAERYTGRDGDGPWSEGDRTPRIDLASIPAGTYDLVVEGEAHRWAGAQTAAPVVPFATISTVPVDLRVVGGGTFGGNIFLALILLAIWPLILLARHLGWEARRMAPVTADDGDDE